MTCNCVKTYRTSAVTLTGGNLYFTLPGIQFNTLPDYTRLNVILCQAIPTTAGTAQVFLSDGITNVEARTITGNYLRADSIKCRRCYQFEFGNDPVHVSLRCGVCPSAYVATTTTATVAETASASTNSTTKAKA
jgi:hypothetical protein